MASRGVSLVLVGKQPKQWLPNEPLYDEDPLTGQYGSTGVVPLTVWLTLPAPLRMEPLPQDNSLEAVYAAQGDPARGDDIRRNAPRQLDAVTAMREQEMFYEGQCDVRDRIADTYENMMVEHDALKAYVAELEAQIGAAKTGIALAFLGDEVTQQRGQLLLNVFYPPGHAKWIHPTALTLPGMYPPAPWSPLETEAHQDIFFLQNL